MRYGLDAEVLQDLSFELEPGSFHFLTGPSGAGKTTLLKLLYLAHRPTRGIITHFGRDLSSVARKHLPAIRRRVGVVFQDFRLLNHLSALENVALPLAIAGGDAKIIMDHAKELLTWVGLGERVEAKPATLSGGEKQRVAIARAVIGRPDLLLADEPTGNVDPQMAQRILHLFVELNKIGTTTVLATHDRSLMQNAKARVLELEQGRMIRHEPVSPEPGPQGDIR